MGSLTMPSLLYKIWDVFCWIFFKEAENIGNQIEKDRLHSGVQPYQN